MTSIFSFNNPPLENIAFLMAKKPELHFDYDEIQFEAHQRAFTVAKVTKIDLLSEIKASLEDAFVEGKSFEEWQKDLKPTLQKAGWLGKEVKVVNPRTNEVKIIQVGASRLKKIFHTNARTAFAQSEARKGYDLPLSEYIRYTAIMDNRTRASHRALHGKIAHRESEFWKRNYPPNGWGCRCSVEFISKEEMKANGWVEMGEAEQKLNFAHKDYSYDTRNLNKDDTDLQHIITTKLKKYFNNTPAKEALMRLREAVRENRLRWERIKTFWKEAKKLSPKELKGNQGKKFIIIAKADKRLQEMLDTKAQEIRLSAWTIRSHETKHPEIGAFNYSLVGHILTIAKNEDIKLSKNKERHIVYFAKYGTSYQAVFKTTRDKKEIYLQSLIIKKKGIKRVSQTLAKGDKYPVNIVTSSH